MRQPVLSASGPTGRAGGVSPLIIGCHQGAYAPRSPGHSEFCPLALIGLVLLLGCGGGRPSFEGKSVEELEAMLADSDPKVQAQGAYGLGQKGREVAAREFDYRSNCRRIVEFVRKLQGLPA